MVAPYPPINYTLDLPQGSIRYSDYGNGPTLLFIQGDSEATFKDEPG